MAHSIQVFRGKVIREKDASFVVLMMFVLRRIPENSTDALDQSISKYWRNAWKCAGPGCIDLKLELLLQTSDDIYRLSNLLIDVENELSQFGKTIPAALLNELVDSSDWVFGDFPAELAVAASSALRKTIE